MMDESGEVIQQPNVEMSLHKVEQRTVAETVGIAERLFHGLGHSLGKMAMRPDAVLAIAGLKGRSDSLHVFNIADEASALRQIAVLNDNLRKEGIKVSGYRNPRGGDFSIHISRSVLGLAYKTSRFNLLNNYNLPKVNKLCSLQQTDDWYDSLDEALELLVAKGKLTKDSAEMIEQGVLLGYPDSAILDFADWYESGRKKQLVEADILSAHPLAMQLGGRITPEFDYYPQSAHDPEIVEYIQNARNVIDTFYKDPSMQEIISEIKLGSD